MKRTYLIRRKDDVVSATVVEHLPVKVDERRTEVYRAGENESTYPLRDLKGYGFEYGYVGSGPHSLGFAILANFLGEANLTQDEWSKSPFLSWKVSHSFSEDFIATMNQEKDEHIIFDAAIRGWFRQFHREIDLEKYKKVREQYREDLRLSARLEEELEAGNLDNELERKAKNDAWDDAFVRIVGYEDWINATTRIR